MIKLLPWSLDLKDILVTMCNTVDRSYLSDRLPDPYTVSDAVSWLGYIQDSEKNGTGIFRAIEVDGNGAGSISVERKGDVYRIDGELGYYLLTKYWNKGIMTRVIGDFVPMAFAALNLRRISANVFAPNIPSAKVLEHNGFLHEGTLRNGAIKNGKVMDVMVWGRCMASL